MTLPLYHKRASFGSGVGVLCEVAQMNFGLLKFKLGECFISCFKQENIYYEVLTILIIPNPSKTHG